MLEAFEDALDFSDRVVCVTGAGQGIGEAVAAAFADAGAAVVVADVDVDAAETTAERIGSEYGTETLPVEVDVTEYDETLALVETAVAELGGLDVLVNNAGVAGAQRFRESDPEDWDRKIGVSLFGTLNCTHAALPELVDRSGVVINYASSSYRGNDPGLAVYGAAKAANRSFTKTLAREVGGDGVRVNCVCPGTVHTPATEAFVEQYADELLDAYALDRIGEPDDVASAVVFLASDAAEWITGETLHVDGGYLRR
ncbi:SDR family NAD(P)-dependent oxidoreductase [Halopenitus persicus]|uniref:SDR family NAD(P)-dependent oxidoreductase n=1 Tax=Halopenitus persicus TaxID=1048396 RepID=UPI000BBB6362|nr:glucose 1-dehydrogenase [Halopenitus persicus]